MLIARAHTQAFTRLALMALLLIWTGGVGSAAAPPEEPAGSTPIIDWPFNTAAGSGLVDVFGTAYVVQDAGDTCSPSSVLENRLPANTGQGGSQLDYNLGGRGMKEIFVSFCWRLMPGFRGLSNGTNKMFFTSVPNRSPAFWAARGGQSSSSYEFIFNPQNFGTLNNCHLSGWEGDCPGSGWLHANAGSPQIVVGQTYRLSVYIKQSTSTTSQNGIVRSWINGTLVHNWTTVNFCCGDFDLMSINHTWDGSIPPSQQTSDTTHHVGNLYMSAPSCPGTCGGGGSTAPPPPPPLPPNKPTNLRVQ